MDSLTQSGKTHNYGSIDSSPTLLSPIGSKPNGTGGGHLDPEGNIRQLDRITYTWYDMNVYSTVVSKPSRRERLLSGIAKGAQVQPLYNERKHILKNGECIFSNSKPDQKTLNTIKIW